MNFLLMAFSMFVPPVIPFDSPQPHPPIAIEALVMPLSRVSDPDPVGSGDFAWIRIRIQFLNFSES